MSNRIRNMTLDGLHFVVDQSAQGREMENNKNSIIRHAAVYTYEEKKN